MARNCPKCGNCLPCECATCEQCAEPPEVTNHHVDRTWVGALLCATSNSWLYKDETARYMEAVRRGDEQECHRLVHEADRLISQRLANWRTSI